MIAMATTLVSVLRATTTDYAGDTVDDNETVAASALPASLVEYTRVSTQPADGASRTVRRAVLRLNGNTDLRTDDRVRDETTGVVWLVGDVRQPQNPVQVNDTTAELSRVG